MAQAVADVVGLHMEAISKTLPELFGWPGWFVNKIETRKDVVKVSSREYRIPTAIRPGSRFGAVNFDGGVLGRGTATKYDKFVLTPIDSRMAVEITDKALAQTDGEPKAIRNLVNLETRNALKEFRAQLNASFQGAGDGVLATLSAAPAGTTITVKSTPFYAQLLRTGQKVSFYDTTLATKRGEAEILTMDYPNSQFTVDAVPVGVVSGDKILPEGLSGATPTWFFGISYGISDAATGTFLGLSRTTIPEIRSNRVNAGSNSLTTPPIRLALNKILQRVAEDESKNVVVHEHPAQLAAYEEMASLVSYIEKTSGNQSVDLMYAQKQMAGVQIEVDTHAARDRIDFLNLDKWGRIESKPIDFHKRRDGSYFERPFDSTTGSPLASQIFYLSWIGQTFTNDPVRQSYISDLVIPAGYDAI